MKPGLASSLVAVSLLAGCAKPAPDVAYPYRNPLTSPGAKLAWLPAPVQQTIRAEAGSAPIYDIIESTNAGHALYKVLFENTNSYPPLYIRSDGSVLYPDMKVAVGAPGDTVNAMSGGAIGGARLGGLPIKVANTVHEKAPGAEIAHVNRFSVGDNTFYEISFKDAQRNPKLVIAEDGTLAEKPVK